jgi:DNA (cytosine-5)-methyltransferase 1
MVRYAEFCTGVGGFRLGIEASLLPSKLVYSNEIDNNCEKTYERNFGSKFDSKDLFNLTSKSLPDFDMLCAGFPCQPFSIAGKELGFGDPRGTIIFKLIEIVHSKKPGIIFLENVTNLLRHNNGATYREIVKCLSDEGYSVSSVVLDSSYFGVPQSRSRIYIVCFRISKYGNKQINFTMKKTPKTPLRPFIIPGDYSIPVSDKWQEYIDYYTGKKKAEDLTFRLTKTRATVERIAPGCDLCDCVFQVRSSGVRALSLDEPLPTLTVLNSGGGAHIPILSKERRHLSIAEMKSIMGFPAWYDFSAVSRTDAAKQLSNAVCPPVIESICNDISAYIDVSRR